MVKKKKLKNNYWNNRVVKETRSGETFYSIREVYYKNDKPNGWSAEARPAVGYDDDLTDGGKPISGVESLRESLMRMVRACDKPVLIEKKIRGKLRLVEES